MRTCWNFKSLSSPLPKWRPGTWLEVTRPDEDDFRFLIDELKVPRFFIDDILDKDEPARYDYDSGWQLILLRIPLSVGDNTPAQLTTVPLGIILKDDVCVSICNFPTEMLPDFISFQRKRGRGFTDAVDLIFRLFLSSAFWYIKCLRQIGALIDEAKHNIDRKIDNADLVRLSRLQDSLTIFLTSIRGNDNLLAKLKYKLPVDALDVDLIEDVNIEMNQARETTDIYSNILDSTMDTYANVINNNMSATMKTMTSLSIILMFPTLVASLFGMNLVSGLESTWWAFPLIFLITALITALLYIFFRKRNLL